MSQTSIISTNDYSTLSKYSMITKGYCSDDYLKYFLFENCSKNNDNNHTAKRAPIIHYGYMIRFKAIEYGWKQLLSDSSNVMNIIISLGSGYDTTPFRYADKNNLFIEIDHPNVCERKAKIIEINDELYRKILPDINNNLQYEEIKLLTSKYSLIGIDLRQSEKLIEILSLVLNLIINNLNDNYMLNFILFNECSLCYIDQNQIDQLFSMIIKMIENNYPEYQNINYLGYEMYDSFECRNDFKKFMLKHFKQINAPIQTFLNEKQIYERFEKMKFEHIQIINMRKFYHEIMSDHELKRITNIEPFDEWEEFENVCQVYCLTLCKLISSNTKDSEFKNHNYINESSDNDSVELAQIINNKNTHSMFTFPIFSHCSFYDKYDNAIYLVGGFGMEPKESFRIDETINHQRYAHGRFKNIMKLSLNESHIEKVDIIKSKNNKSYIDRLHCRVVPVDNSGKHFFISGGRKSPNNPLNNCIIKINDGKDEFEIIETIDNINTYRHVCSKFESRNQICQFGGISSNDQSKIWLYDLHKSSWSSSIINGLKTDRHSSAFTQYNDHSILINGGLDYDDNKFIDNDIQLIDYRSSMVEKFQIKNFNKKFYSHQMKTLDNDNNKLLIIGGICNENISNHLFEIDLRMMNELITSIDLNIDFGENDNRIVMLHNFSSEIIANDKYLMTIGGGGNCFSFGTHFNPILMIQL